MTDGLDARERRRLQQLYAERLAAQEEEVPGYTAMFRELERRICGVDQLLVPPPQPDADLASLVRFVEPVALPVVLVRGEPNACHSNSARLFVAGEIDRVVTGFALTGSDQLWRQHSAGWRQGPGADRRAGGTLVETTVGRAAYAAGRLSLLGSWVFAAAELDSAEMAGVVSGERMAQLGALIESGALGGEGDGSAIVALGDTAWDPWRGPDHLR